MLSLHELRDNNGVLVKVFTISKRNGSRRTIFAPSEEEKEKLRRCLPALSQKQEQADVSDVQHGFRAGRSPVTNAMQHRGYAFTLSMDLEDFFDSVTVGAMMAQYGNWTYTVGFYRDCYVDTCGVGSDAGTSTAIAGTHAARQGLPTSPLLANIAASPMDTDICALRGSRGRFRTWFVYTRYADDLTFSFDDDRIHPILMDKVPAIVEKHGFKINEAKTRLQAARAGRRIVTGIAVDDALHPTRVTKRRLRAMIHQHHMQQAQGLAEWVSLKIPKAYQKRAPVKAVTAAKPVAAPVPKSNQPQPPAIAPVVRRRFSLND